MSLLVPFFWFKQHEEFITKIKIIFLSLNIYVLNQPYKKLVVKNKIDPIIMLVSETIYFKLIFCGTNY